MNQYNKRKSHYLIHARAWISDCDFGLDNLTDEEVIKTTNRYYEGGWEELCQMIDCCFYGESVA